MSGPSDTPGKAPGDVPTPVPILLRWLLHVALPPQRRRDLAADMETLFARKAAERGHASASAWYLRHSLGFLGVRVRDALVGALRAAGDVARDGGRDLRYAVRSLIRRPGYTFTIVATLGLGSGGVVAVFGVANWVLLRPVPGVPAADELVTLRLEVRDPSSPAFPVSDLDLASLRDLIGPLDALEGATRREADLVAGSGQRPRRITAAAVTSGWFDVLGVTPVAGTLPRPGDEGADGVVVSDRMARALFGGASAAVGRSVRLNGRVREVSAVAPRGFRGPELPGDTDVWVPAAGLSILDPDVAMDFEASRSTAVWNDLVGRMRPGSAAPTVAASSDAALDRVRDEFGYEHSFAADFVLRAWPGLGLSPRVRSDAQRILLLLSAAGGLLWLLAVANAANLSLTSAVTRQSADAIHGALGASRSRIVRRSLVEHGVVGIVGAVLSVGVAVGALELFRGSSVTALGASLEDLAFDHRGVLFAGAVGMLAAIVAGVVPRVALLGSALAPKLVGRSSTGRSTHRAQDALVAAQVALSLTLLLSSGLLLRNFSGLVHTPTGFDVDRTARFAIDPRLDGPDRAEGDLVLDRVAIGLEADPEIERVGFVWPTLVRPAWLTSSWSPSGADDPVLAAQYHTTEGFLPAIGARLVAGRLHRPEDRHRPGASEPASVDVVVTESFATAAFPALRPEDVVGRSLVHPRGTPPDIRVVGVVADLRTISLVEGSPPAVFLPWGLAEPDVVTGWARATSDPRRLPGRISDAVARAAPDLPVFDVRTGRAQVDHLVVSEKVLARLGSALALLGVLLAGVGLYGLLSYTVASRRREIGVRMALGAGSVRIGRAIAGRAMRPTLAGLVLGGVMAALAGRAVASYLHGLSPADPVTWVSVVALLLTVALAAAAVPSLRSARVDPNEILRSE